MAASMVGGARLMCFEMNRSILARQSFILKWIKSHRYKTTICSSISINDNFGFCHLHSNATPHKYVPKVNRAEKVLSHAHLKQLLQKCKSVKEQFEVFNSYTELPKEEVSFRHSVCRDIECIFKPHFPKCSVHLTGSTVSGLGLKGCDLDLSFQFSDDESNRIERVKEINSVSIINIKKGEVPVSLFPFLGPWKRLHLLQKVLVDSEYDGPTTIVPGRCPILSFSYQNLICDLAVDNKSALHGTNLMLLCGLLDDRVVPLYRLLSYWFKRHQLFGGLTKFKSYAIFLLVVHFLQTREPPVLPSIQHIFDKSEFVNNQDNWSYDICKYLRKFDRSKNCRSTEELLQDFFIYYADFDFTYVICPLANQLVKNSTVKSDPANDQFMVTEISIQDPLHLDYNVTSGTKARNCIKFKKVLFSMCEIYKNGQHWLPSAEDWGLLSLLHSDDASKKVETI